MSAHPKVDDATGELLFFTYSKQAPYMRYGVVDANYDLVHIIDIPLPGPRLPHDMAFTPNYAILNDFPMFWDPKLFEADIHLPGFHPDMPSRFAVIPRHGGPTRSGGSRPTRHSCCTSPTPTRTATRSCSTAFTRVIPHRSITGDKWQKAFRFLALDGSRPGCTGGDSTL